MARVPCRPIPLDGLASLSYTNGQGQTLNNRITSANFTYDPAGNQTRAVVDAGGAQQQYRYDAAGRLAQVLNADGSAVLATYSYGAGNQRLMSVEGGATTYYAWDGGQVIAEYVPAETSGWLSFQRGYVYLGGRLLATVGRNAGSDTRFHHPDRLGTNVVTDQSNGELVTKQMVLPYGTQQPTGGRRRRQLVAAFVEDQSVAEAVHELRPERGDGTGLRGQPALQLGPGAVHSGRSDRDECGQFGRSAEPQSVCLLRERPGQ